VKHRCEDSGRGKSAGPFRWLMYMSVPVLKGLWPVVRKHVLQCLLHPTDGRATSWQRVNEIMGRRNRKSNLVAFVVQDD